MNYWGRKYIHFWIRLEETHWHTFCFCGPNVVHRLAVELKPSWFVVYIYLPVVDFLTNVASSCDATRLRVVGTTGCIHWWFQILWCAPQNIWEDESSLIISCFFILVDTTTYTSGMRKHFFTSWTCPDIYLFLKKTKTFRFGYRVNYYVGELLSRYHRCLIYCQAGSDFC